MLEGLAMPIIRKHSNITCNAIVHLFAKGVNLSVRGRFLKHQRLRKLFVWTVLGATNDCLTVKHVKITHVFIDPRDHLHRARRAWQCCPHVLALGTSSDETGGLANFGSFHGNTGAM